MSLAPTTGFGCAICSDTFDVNVPRNICTIPQCGHVYHEYCVKRWFRTQLRQGIPSNCPKCRTPTVERQIIRLFLHQTTSISNSDASVAANEDEYDDNDKDNNSSTTEEVPNRGDSMDIAVDGFELMPPLTPISLMPRLIPIHAQTNNNPRHGVNLQGLYTSFGFGAYDDDAASFSQWTPPNHAPNSWANSLNALDQRLLSLNTDFTVMSDTARLLESYIQTFPNE